MRKILVILVVLLSACAVPVVQEFPTLPASLLKACPALETIDTKEITLSELTKIVVKNYGYSHECAIQLIAIQEWYKEQKSVFDKAGK